jgi:hypothetical protein
MIVATFRYGLVALGLVAAASPATAQWTRVSDLPASDVFSVGVSGDSIVAGTKTLAYVSTDAGASWQPSSQPGVGVPSIRAVLVRNRRLYAGTSGQGVFISNDLGQTWQGFNEGLVGGIFNSQLDISDLRVRGDSLYAATLGAGVYVRNLAGAGTWSHFGEEFEPNQASNVEALAVGGTRLLAAAGGNGSVFFRDPGDAEWTLSWLDNVGLHPGFQASSAGWTGTGWVVGVSAARGVFRSTLGQEPWTFVNLNIGVMNHTALAIRGHRLFGAFDIVNNAVIEHSGDDGATWQVLDVLPNVFVYKMAMSGTDLYAGRLDGLWRRSTATVSVPGNDERTGLRFALAGPQPVADVVRFSFKLPEAGSASIEIFDVTGRRTAEIVQPSMSAGAHDVSWNARALVPGVYEARLTARGRQEVVRLVRVR